MNKYSHLNYYGATSIEMNDDVMFELFGEVIKYDNKENDTNNGNRESKNQ